MNDINLTVGHIARHTPHGAGAQGRDAAIVDIAQDLLLRHLHSPMTTPSAAKPAHCKANST